MPITCKVTHTYSNEVEFQNAKSKFNNIIESHFHDEQNTGYIVVGETISDIEIIAEVEGWNMVPDQWPINHRFYKRNHKGFVHLTDEGREIYEQHKGEVDLLIETVVKPKLDTWIKKARKVALA